MPCDAPASTDEVIAIEVWNMLNNGMGGVDLGPGLDVAVAYFGVRDVRGLLDRLRVIKAFRPPEENKPAAAPTRRVLGPRGRAGKGG